MRPGIVGETMTKRKQPCPWNQLVRLINLYTEAKIADAEKGGGDPDRYGEIEAYLKYRRLQLSTHIAKLKQESGEDA